MEGRNRYRVMDNMRFYLGECIRFRRAGTLLCWLLIPAILIRSLASIVIPKIVIDSIEGHAGEKDFLLRILAVVVAIAISSVTELVAQNSMEHNMNSFVLIRLNSLWVTKVSDMDYETFISDTGKQASNKARMMLEGTTRWGIGTYMPRLLRLITAVIGFGVYGAMLVYVHPVVLAALLLTYLINLLVTLSAEKKKQLLRDDAARAERKMNYFAYSTRGYDIAKDIRVYSMREWIRQMATAARYDKKKVDEKIESYKVSVIVINSLLVFLRDGAVYTILIMLALNDKITVGEFALYAAAVTGLGEWLSQITSGIGEFKEADNHVTDFRKFLDLPDGKSYTERSLESAPSIELKNVSFSYDKENKILDDISIKVRAGEKIAIVGSNGAGKTTLIKIICGLLRPDSGSILTNGEEDKLRGNISAVFQDSALLPVSIRRNITMNDSGIDEERLRKVIALAGLEDKIRALENGVETPLVKHITENGTEFSGGEVQKLFLARAIYKESPVLILDEPTAALDPIAEQNIYLRYNELTGNKTSFFISHRLSSTRFCDRIILIDSGKIKEEGTHDELMKKGGLYHDMFMVQSKLYQEEKEEAV